MQCVIVPVLLVCRYCKQVVHSYASIYEGYVHPVVPAKWLYIEPPGSEYTWLVCDNVTCCAAAAATGYYHDPAYSRHGTDKPCKHCQKMPEEHAGNKCLFGPTTYEADLLAPLLEMDI